MIYYALSLKSLSEVEDKSNAIQPGAKKILLILNQNLLANWEHALFEERRSWMKWNWIFYKFMNENFTFT